MKIGRLGTIVQNNDGFEDNAKHIIKCWWINGDKHSMLYVTRVCCLDLKIGF